MKKITALILAFCISFFSIFIFQRKIVLADDLSCSENYHCESLEEVYVTELEPGCSRNNEVCNCLYFQKDMWYCKDGLCKFYKKIGLEYPSQDLIPKGYEYATQHIFDPPHPFFPPTSVNTKIYCKCEQIIGECGRICIEPGPQRAMEGCPGNPSVCAEYVPGKNGVNIYECSDDGTECKRTSHSGDCFYKERVEDKEECQIGTNLKSKARWFYFYRCPCNASKTDCESDKSKCWFEEEGLGDHNFVGYSCVKEECGAECSKDSDCDDGDPETIDTCNTTIRINPHTLNPDACLCNHTDPNLPSYCQYDFDNNGTIGLGDLNHILENWNDFNNGFSDYLLLILQYWGMGGC